jgi:hypothetical protein
MPSTGMSHLVAVVRTEVSNECFASVIRVARIGDRGTSAVISNRRTLLVAANVGPTSPILVTLMMEAIRASETSVLRATWNNILEDSILHSHRR